MYWTTKTGEKIKISDMSDKHLTNTYNLIYDRLIRFTNKCMSQNEETDIPTNVEITLNAIQNEMYERGLFNFEGDGLDDDE